MGEQRRDLNHVRRRLEYVRRRQSHAAWRDLVDHARAAIRPRLRTDRLVTALDEAANHLLDGNRVLTVGMAVDHRAFTGTSAQELIDRHPGLFALDVPQR